jgi:hypothetical protein
MTHVVRKHRRLFGIAILFAVLLQGFAVANAATSTPDTDVAAHCADMEKESQDDCCSCCPEGAVMTGGCTSVCIAHCSNDAAALDLPSAIRLAPASTSGPTFVTQTQIPPTPPPISL